ncbi:Zinc finger protein 385D [Amphibalanus amphitrite]|uniref:Zinc finger protein 385D n=1 Tax=Amphibalanus amphitrite TaxID=1232801 RepID=A0A6A4W4M7_AMPAM|nr:Zinc finger protein 385D [Amphibalanus amphitrite]
MHFQVKSRQILSDLKEKIPAATGINSMFRCALCDITLNSSQQLAMHLSGSRHKMNEKTKRCGSAIVLADRQPVAVAAAAKPKTAVDSKPAKPPVQTFKCVACNVDLNSESQRDQHMNSKKHANKIAGNKVSLAGGSLNSVSLSSGLSTSNSGLTTGGLSGGGLARGIGRGRASWLGKGGGTDWIGNGGGYTPASGGDPGYSGGYTPASGGYTPASGGDPGYSGAALGSTGDYSASAGGYSGAAAGYSGAAAGFSASAGLEMGDQGDFNMPEAGQFSNATYHNASGGGGGDYSSPVGPVFRGRGGQAHAALPYSRPPPPLPTQPPPQQPPPPPPVFQ